jgi:hypothetical protein
MADFRSLGDFGSLARTAEVLVTVETIGIVGCGQMGL